MVGVTWWKYWNRDCFTSLSWKYIKVLFTFQLVNWVRAPEEKMVIEGEPPAKKANHQHVYIHTGYADPQVYAAAEILAPSAIKNEPRMDVGYQRTLSPPEDKVSSAADAMLKLSNSSPPTKPLFIANPNQFQYSTVQQQSSLSQKQASPGTLSGVTNSSSADLKNILPNASKIIRKQREFIPDFKKDEGYWSKRRKNNEAAKRSREKRRMNDVAMAQKIVELTNENTNLKRELEAIKRKYGLRIDQQFPIDEISAKSTYEDISDTSCDSPQKVQLRPQQASLETEHFSAISSAIQKPIASIQQQQHLQSQTVIPQVPASAFPVGGQLTVNSSTNPSGLRIPVARPPRLVHVSELQEGTHSMSLLTRSENYVNETNLPPIDLQNRQQDDGMLDMTSLTLSQPQAAQQLPVVAQDLSVTSFGSYHGESNDAAEFHSRIKIPDICRPISPDELSNSPGSLTVAFSGCSSSNENSGDEDGPEPLNLSSTSLPPARESRESSPSGLGQLGGRRKGIPHKLRHKFCLNAGKHTYEYLGDGAIDQNKHNKIRNKTNVDPSGPAPLLDNADGIDEFSDSDVSMSSTFSSSSAARYSKNDTDPKYLERRKRNNLAARKCRENRRLMNMMRAAKSGILENENSRLKDELNNLAAEVNNLKQMIEKKNEAKAKGENFEPPPLETIQAPQVTTNGTEAAT